MSMDATLRWRAAVLAALAAVSFTLVGCNDSSPADTPGVEHEEPDDDGY